MTSTDKPAQHPRPPSPERQARNVRLEQQLRANLAKRKAAARTARSDAVAAAADLGPAEPGRDER